MVGAVHKVVPGDTLYSLSRRYGVSQAALMAANGLASPNELRAGMRLRLPGQTQPTMARKTRRAASPAAKLAAAADPCRELKTPDIRPEGALAGISDPPPGPKPPLSIPTTYKVNPSFFIGPEYKNADAALLSSAGGGDFGGYGPGLKASFLAKKDASFVGMFGYSMDFSASRDPGKPLGADADAAISGFGAGVGLRRSF